MLLGEVDALRSQAAALRQELSTERTAHTKEQEAVALEVGKHAQNMLVVGLCSICQVDADSPLVYRS